jgi:hypothetical protein
MVGAGIGVVVGGTVGLGAGVAVGADVGAEIGVVVAGTAEGAATPATEVQPANASTSNRTRVRFAMQALYRGRRGWRKAEGRRQET